MVSTSATRLEPGTLPARAGEEIGRSDGKIVESADRDVTRAYLRPLPLWNQKRFWFVYPGKLVPEEQKQANLGTGYGSGDADRCQKGLQAIAGICLCGT